jgi:hypothetical protein
LGGGGWERYRDRRFQRGKRPEYVHFRCDKTLGKECNVVVIFTPVDDTTAETGSLVVDNATRSPQSISLEKK